MARFLTRNKRKYKRILGNPKYQLVFRAPYTYAWRSKRDNIKPYNYPWDGAGVGNEEWWNFGASQREDGSRHLQWRRSYAIRCGSNENLNAFFSVDNHEERGFGYINSFQQMHGGEQDSYFVPASEHFGFQHSAGFYIETDFIWDANGSSGDGDCKFY